MEICFYVTYRCLPGEDAAAILRVYGEPLVDRDGSLRLLPARLAGQVVDIVGSYEINGHDPEGKLGYSGVLPDAAFLAGWPGGASGQPGSGWGPVPS